MKSFWLRLSLASIALLLIALTWIYEGAAQSNHYRIVSMHNALIWQDVELSFASPMCWNNQVGWCDPDLEGYRQRWIVIVDSNQHGAIYKRRDSCYIWIFQPDYGTDGHPHIAAHSWIECP